MLSFLLLCPVFSINASAADEENIVSTDFREWTVFDGNVILNKSGDYNTMICRPSILPSVNVSLPYCTVYDLTDGAVVGNKYQISFNFRNSDKYLGDAAGVIGSEAFLSYGGVMFVGLGTLTTLSNGEKMYEPVDGCHVQVTKDNYSQMTDTLTEFSFEMPNGVINPCIMIWFACTVDTEKDINKAVYLVFEDFSAIDLTKSEEDGFINKLINGIKGLFVPDDAFISQWKSDMEQTLSDHLGFIYQIPALTIDYVERLQVLFNDKSIYFSIPACQFELNGEFINLWPKTSVDFSFLTNAEKGTIWHTIYKQMYPVFLRLVLFGILIKYGRNEWDKVMMN